MSCCSFTLTFAVEVLIENDKSNGNNNQWMDLGPCSQGLKLQYNLYPGYTYDLDVLMWPNACKIWCVNKYCWARTWKILNTIWMAFTIRHKIPAKIEEFLNYQVFITPITGMTSLSANAKNDKNFVIRIPPLEFRELRYFGKIEEQKEEDVIHYIIEIVWNNISKVIPPGHLDVAFDTPQPVTDLRHQDAIIGYIKENTLLLDVNLNKTANTDASLIKDKGRKMGTETESTVYKLKLTGVAILAGSDRINRFVEVGQCSLNQGRVLAVISSSNLPTQEDLPIVVINVNRLKGIPTEEFFKAGFSQIYTRCYVGSKEYNSQVKKLTTQTEINFDEHYVIPIERSIVREVFNVFMENSFEIQLRGIREEKKLRNNLKLFNEGCSCRSMNTFPTKDTKEEDILIAGTRIDVQQIFQRPNKMISREFAFFPPRTSFSNLKYDCTNDVNAIVPKKKQKTTFSPYIVLSTHMSLDASIGLLGCEIHITRNCFARLFCFCVKGHTPYSILKKIMEINKKASIATNDENILTGFSLDTGDSLLIFVEGEKNKDIVKVWETVESFYSGIECVFSSSDTYLERIYPELSNTETPFDSLIMRIPLSTLLACPSVYVRPALPLPAKTAMLKISHILTGKMCKAPSRYEMPTAAELRSFKLELCLPHLPSSTKQI